MYGSLLLFVELFGIFMSIFVICFQYKHLLMILLAMESLGLVLFVMALTSCSYIYMSDVGCVLIVIVFGVCEASLSLAVMVMMISAHGNDYVKSFDFINC
uniref:NADH-ubiquinone oxidoreductase chain 4L n=1 Tax=Pleuropoma jana TaxID=1882665 RepID=A0A1B2G3A9_9GAST|nr:NADH dehydrogenase subunit 4L [Pleuropoma jana]